MAEQIVNKRCYKCKQVKPTSEFHKRNSSKDGHDWRCKKCCLEYAKKYRQKHRAGLSEYARKYHSSLNGNLRTVWDHMLHRCNDPKDKRYKNYGGRGIEVKFACFEDFFSYVTNVLKADPRGLTIDRIDNNGHYEPGNIRFVTRAENNRNK